MNKTLSQLKRDIQEGTEVMLIKHLEKGTTIISNKLLIPRLVSKKDTTGIYIEKSFLKWPKSRELIYIDDTFTVRSFNPITGDIITELTYKILNEPKQRIIYT